MKKLSLFVAILMCLSILCACADSSCSRHQNTDSDSSLDQPAVADTTDINQNDYPTEPEPTYDITKYTHSSNFLALIHNHIPYYYCGNITTEAELKEYIASAELVGTSTAIDENTFPTNELESNFVLDNSAVIISGDYIIVEFAQPQKWQSQTIYGQVLKIAESTEELPVQEPL